ncbi:MAG: adenosylhomocysteinase, partial [Thermoplasmatales archaeon]
MEGKNKIEWAINWMPVLGSIRERMSRSKPFKRLKVAMALHLEAKTAALAYTLKAGGADVRIAGCNPLSTDDEVAKSLKQDFHVDVYARRGIDRKEYYEYLSKTLEFGPDIIIDDGGDLTTLALDRK